MGTETGAFHLALAPMYNELKNSYSTQKQLLLAGT